jgi:hypothetical protein
MTNKFSSYRYYPLLVIGLLFSIHQLNAQLVDDQQKFLYLYGDTVVYGKQIEVVASNNQYYFVLDSVMIKPERVEFYNNQTGLFANIKYLHPNSLSLFAPRIVKGNINLYEKEFVVYTPITFDLTTHMNSGGEVTAKLFQNYYNKGYEKLKLVSLKNLKVDLADNSESMIYINKCKSINKKQTFLNIVGGMAFLTGIASLASNDFEFNKVSGWGIGLGAGCFVASYTLSFPKQKHIQKAIEAYNKVP